MRGWLRGLSPPAFRPSRRDPPSPGSLNRALGLRAPTSRRARGRDRCKGGDDPSWGSAGAAAATPSGARPAPSRLSRRHRRAQGSADSAAGGEVDAAGLDAGARRQRPARRRRSSGCHRDPRISFAGEIGEAGRDAFLDELDLLVIPSEWEEPATLVAVEAAVRGLPTLVSDRGGLPETPHAQVFEAGDDAALLAGLAKFDRNPELVSERSTALLNSGSSYRWSTHLEAVEGALLRAVVR